MTLPKYSVLMSVYHKENPEYFKLAMESMFNQSYKLSELILVCDGELTPKLDEYIDYFQKNYNDVLKVVRLPENKGLANALNKGLEYCTNEYVARMDTDDISLNNRMEKQLSAMLEHNADLCSGTIEEFETDPSVVSSVKALPKSHEEIAEYSRSRNPFNHPCMVYKKSAVKAVGGYEQYPFFEDYHLWVKMLNNGCIGYNLADTLLKMRTGDGMYNRRGGYSYFKKSMKLERYKLQIGYIGLPKFISSGIVKFVFSIVPNGIRKKLYNKLLRKQ